MFYIFVKFASRKTKKNAPKAEVNHGWGLNFKMKNLHFENSDKNQLACACKLSICAHTKCRRIKGKAAVWMKAKASY